MKQLAIFDLDNTLLEGDSDYAWSTYIAEHLVEDPEAFIQQSQAFYEDYDNCTLDIHAYFDFVMSPVKSLDLAAINTLLENFVAGVIPGMIRPKAQSCVKEHKAEGATTLIITATSSLVTNPIQQFFEIDHLMGTDPEWLDGKITGKIKGIPCFKEGKIERLKAWLKTQDALHPDILKNAYFYSDSINDAPLLNLVGNPRIVNPDNNLKALAEKNGWPVLDFSHSQ